MLQTKPYAAATLARTVGPFLLASNLWTAYRALGRGRRRRESAAATALIAPLVAPLVTPLAASPWPRSLLRLRALSRGAERAPPRIPHLPPRRTVAHAASARVTRRKSAIAARYLR